MKPAPLSIALFALAGFAGAVHGRQETPPPPAAAPASPGAETAQPPALVILRGVTIVEASGVRPDLDVLLRGDRIDGIAPAGAIRLARGAVSVDATGKFLVPGLWDLHLHLTIVEDQKTSERLLPMIVRYGVTSVRDMGGDLARLGALKQAVAKGAVGPRIFTPGPVLDGAQEPSPNFLPVTDAASARSAIAKLKKEGADFLKVQAGLSPEAYRAILAEAKAAKLTVAGHVPDAVSAFEVAASGQRSVEHVSAILPGDAGLLLACSSREEELRAELQALGKAAQEKGADRAKLRERQRALQRAMMDTTDEKKRQRLFSLLVKNRVAWVPTLIWGKSIAPLSAEDLGQNVPLSMAPPALRERWEKRRSDVVKASTEEDYAFRRRLFTSGRDLVAAAHKAGVTILPGTDAIDAFVVPGFSLHQELELLTEAGLTAKEALDAATRGAARFLDVKDAGTVEVGKRADLVLLDANPLLDIKNTRRIAGVVLAGRYLAIAELDKAAAATVTP